MVATPMERVFKGALFLDRNRPGWLLHININTLDMRDDYLDILGQIFGSFLEGCNVLNIKSGAEAAGYGFEGMVDPEDKGDYDTLAKADYEALRVAWAITIKEHLRRRRRSARPLTLPRVYTSSHSAR